MSTATIAITFTDPAYRPTAVTMTSLTREDNNANVAYTAAWTDATNGVWTNTFTTPDAGLAYNWRASALINSVGYLLYGTFVDAAPGYVGRYTASDILKRRFGTDNLAAWSDMTGQKNLNETAIEEAIRWGDDEIDGRFGTTLYAVPLTPTGANPLPRQIREWANTYSGWKLYTRRGFADEGVGGMFKKLKEDTDLEIPLYTAGLRRLAYLSYKDGVTSAVSTLEPTLNSLSQNAALYPNSQSRFFGRRFTGQMIQFFP